MMSQYFITPLHKSKKEHWEKMYGRSYLPVKYPSPHIACTQRWGEVPVYYLEVTAVPDALLDRLATFEAKRLGIHYQEARALVRREWLIRADDCQVVKSLPEKEPTWQPSFTFLQKVPLRPAPAF